MRLDERTTTKEEQVKRIVDSEKRVRPENLFQSRIRAFVFTSY